MDSAYARIRQPVLSPTLEQRASIMPPRKPAADGREHRLSPITLRPWRDAADVLAELWLQIDAALVDVALPAPMLDGLALKRITNEAELGSLFHRAYGEHVLATLNTLVHHLPWLHHVRDPDYPDAPLHIRMERLARPRFAQRFALAKIADEFATNPALHDHLVTLAAHGQLGPVPMRADATVDYARLLEHVARQLKARVTDTKSDYELVYEPVASLGAAREVVPALVCELKCPHVLDVETLRSVLVRFPHHCLDQPDDAVLWDAETGTIHLRQALWLPGVALTTEAAGVAAYVVQLYNYMLAKRQTYGLLTSVAASLVLKIDWSGPTVGPTVGPTEAGQHLEYLVLPGPGEVRCYPEVRAEMRPFDLTRAMVSLAVLQLTARRVGQDEVDRLALAVYAHQQVYAAQRRRSDTRMHSDSSSLSSSAGGGSDFSPASSTSSASSASSRSSSLSGVSDVSLLTPPSSIHSGGHDGAAQRCETGAPVQDAFRLPLAVLATVTRRQVREELERLFATSSSSSSLGFGGCWVAEGAEMLALCCALWPLRTDRRTRRRLEPLRTRWLHHELVLPRTLEYGPVPEAWQRALAQMDAQHQKQQSQLLDHMHTLHLAPV